MCAGVTVRVHFQTLSKGKALKILSAEEDKRVRLYRRMLKDIRNVKESIVILPVLVHPNFSQPIIVTTDASNEAIGTVLSQKKN